MMLLAAFSVAVLGNWGYLAAIAGVWIVALVLVVRPWRKHQESEEAEKSPIGLSWGDTADAGVNDSGSPE
jgi:hypothetical protein